VSDRATSHERGAALPASSWTGALFCHAPADEPVDLEALAEAGGRTDRWSEPGEPTAYLGSDPGVVLAELGRHRGEDESNAEFRLLRLRVRIDDLLDLRDPTVLDALEVTGAPCAFLDRAVARRVAARVRDSRSSRGLIVPSIAFLDRPDRCNVVVFAESLEDGISGIVETWSDAGQVRIDPTGDGGAADTSGRARSTRLPG
jgi:RES domain-containing protein